MDLNELRRNGEATTSQPIFILSGPRSGSTLLRYILDTHSQIASPGEINLGMLCDRLELVLRSTKGEALHELPKGERDARILAETRAVVDGIMGSYLALKGKRIWCDKSISNLRELAVLTTIYPEARFICLHRDSIDFVHSCLECSRHAYMDVLCKYVASQPDNLIAAMMTAWVDNTTLLLEFERRHREQCFRIRYEDLVTAPEDSLRPLLGFVGVGWEEGLLAAVFSSRHDQGAGDTKILFASRIDPARIGSGQLLDLTLVPEPTRLAADRLSAQLSYPPLAPGRRLPWMAAVAPGAEPEAAAEPSQPIEALLQQRLGERAEQATAIRGSCRLVVKGPGGGIWKLAFGGGSAALVRDEGDADCTLIVNAADFKQMFAGRLNPFVAIWDGKLSIEGEPTIAADVGRLLAS